MTLISFILMCPVTYVHCAHDNVNSKQVESQTDIFL